MQQQLIRFVLVSADEKLEITVRRGAYRNLMDLINDKLYVEDFGECRGIGRCGTCLISFTSDTDLPEMDRNEQSTLAKTEFSGKGWRLSCQLMIDETLDGSTITIAEVRPDVR